MRGRWDGRGKNRQTVPYTTGKTGKGRIFGDLCQNLKNTAKTSFGT